MQNKILITVATHGDEGFSIPVVQKLAIKFKFDWLISNPKALEQKKRYLDVDMNRCAPGDQNSKLYEESRVSQIIQIAKDYHFVIDIHGTVSDSGLFVILSNPSMVNIEFAKKINLKNVVLWPSLKPKGPLTQLVPGLEIECGLLNQPETTIQLERVLTDFFESSNPQQQDYYIVTGKLETSRKKLSDFQPTKLANGDTVIPLLVNSYRDFICYKMSQILEPLVY